MEAAASGSGFRRTSAGATWTMTTLVIFTVLLAILTELGATYKQGDKVILYVNKVGPYFNPHETYHYYQLPVCRPNKIEHKSLTLGEVLNGDRMAVSNYEIIFKEDMAEKTVCEVHMDNNDISKLKDAIEDLYYFEFVMDEIPLRGFIGHLEEGGFLPHTHKIYLWTHLSFNIEYNGDKIIAATVNTRDHSPVNLDNLQIPAQIKYTYSVHWHPTSDTFESRMKKVQNMPFFPKSLEIHWISIINSVVLVMLLIGFVIVILTRILRNDFARYNMDDELSTMEGDEYGWKIIHADVFRFPPCKSLFCAILGVGVQFLAIALGIILMALMDMFNVHHHGSMNSAACVLYALTSCIAGFVSSCMYKKMGGQHWVWNINLASCLFSFPFFIIWSIQNSVAWSYKSTQALPFTTILLLICIWMFVGYPLAILGGIFGRNCGADLNPPCRTKNIPRDIPRVPWYQTSFAHCAVGGFLPFSAVSVELYYIFATLWGREQYTLYGILFLVFFILLSVTACVSVALTYFQLSAEDYRWWWRSIFSAGSTGFFVFFYAVFYYFHRSNMSGTLQAVQFFGDTVLTCYVFFLSLGTVSFFASLRFILYIYRNIKMD